MTSSSMCASHLSKGAINTSLHSLMRVCIITLSLPLLNLLYHILNTQYAQHPIRSTPNTLNTQYAQHPIRSTPNTLNTQYVQHPIRSTPNTLNTQYAQHQTQSPTTFIDHPHQQFSQPNRQHVTQPLQPLCEPHSPRSNSCPRLPTHLPH
jgi:hypothetical protein